MNLKYEFLLYGSEEEMDNKIWRLYSAVMQNLQSSQRDEIELDEAEHLFSLGKMDVEAVQITDSKILFMPRIDKHFNNLVALDIVDCGLQEITKEDLQPFNLLKLLNLNENSIQSLPADLFENTTLIEQLSLRSNEIRFISQDTLTPLLHLKYADFKANVTIDECYDCEEPISVSLSVLKLKIVRQCMPLNEQTSTVSSYVHNLWQGEFSDFKIKAKEEVLNVHKAVLAVNSPVFAAMFSHEMEENVKNEMTIPNFCPETIKEFLAFVYLRKIPEKCFNASDLYAMAEEYQVKELSARTQWLIADEVNTENASEMFKLGALYNNEVIKQTDFQEIEKSLNKKLPTNLMESVDDMMELLEAKEKLDEVMKRAS